MAEYHDKADMELMLRGAPKELPSIRVQLAAPPPPVVIMPQAGGFQEYARIFRRHVWLILGCSIGGALLGVSIALPQKPLYRAQTVLEVLNPSENLINLSGLESGGAASSPDSYVETQTKLLQGDELIERAALKLHLDSRPEVFQSPSLLSRFGLETKRPASPEHAAARLEQARIDTVERVKESLSARSAPQSRLIEVQFESADPKLAAEFLNVLANELIGQNLEARYQAAQKTMEWLAQPLRELKSNLERSEEALQVYARSSGMIVHQDKGSTAGEDRLRQVQEELSRAQADRAAKQARYEIALSAPAQSLGDVLDYGPLRDTQARLTELRRQLAELSATFEPGFYKVKNVQAQILEMEAALRREQNNILDRIRNDYGAAQRREILLQGRYNVQAEQVSREAGAAARYETLKSEVDANRAVYTPVMERVKEVGIASAIRASNIRVITHANPPRHPVRPKPVYNAGAGFLAGLFLASAFVLIREQSSRRIRFPGEASFDLNLMELGAIPSHKIRRMAAADPRVLNVGAKQRRNGIFRRKHLEGLIDWNRDASQVAESLRSTLASLWFAGEREHRRLRVFVVTSPGASEGKTMLVSQLGAALSNTNRRVLLIDADLRRPRLHRMFGLDRSWGLGNLLEENHPIEDYSFQDMFVKTDLPGLYVLPSGTGMGNIAGLRYQERLMEFMSRVRLEFHAVLIDTPPVLHFSDARILGAVSDAVLLVFRAGKTSHAGAAAALKRLRDDGLTVLGSILNDWNPKDSPDGYESYDYSAPRSGEEA